VDNGEIRNLTNNPGNDTQPNWVRSSTLDASGEHIVFTSDRDGNQEIYRMKTDGAEAVNLTGNPASDQMAKGAADGVLLAFTTNRDGNQEIYSMRIDGNGLVNATNHPANDFGASWSTNQAWIAFTSDRDGNREVYLFTAPGRPELYNLTKYPGYDQAADWR
jgi:TolB protein